VDEMFPSLDQRQFMAYGTCGSLQSAPYAFRGNRLSYGREIIFSVN